MYSRNYNQPSVPNNYKGTFYQFDGKGDRDEEQKQEDVPTVGDTAVCKSAEKPSPLLSNSFKISLDTEDLLLLGLVFLLIANGDQSDLLLIVALLFATGLFQF